MPGAYAHLSMVTSLATPAMLSSSGIPRGAIGAIQQYTKFCQLGALSPDLPYLDFMKDDSKYWADQMHYTNVGNTLRAGIAHVTGLSGSEQSTACAWLLGYIAHVTTDVTIHPVVNLIVGGEYETHKKEHRECEMHQDAYIFPLKVRAGGVGQAGDYLRDGIGTCYDPLDKNKLHPVIKATWREMLNAASPGASANTDFDEWFDDFVDVVSATARFSERLVPIARHVVNNLDILYPKENEIDQKFINNINTPDGEDSYDNIFNRARSNVLKTWKFASQAIFEQNDSSLDNFGNWNLDTGKTQGNDTEFVMW